MQKIYLDCDGVILDTINKSSKMLKQQSLTTEEEVRAFYCNICWEKLIIESGEINNAINKIKKLMKHFDITILTHVNSEKEVQSKLKYFNKELPNINVITVPKTIEKADYVNPVNIVLVDDSSSNLEYWKKKGGIPIKFSDSDEEEQYIVINDLLELLNLNELMVKE